MNAGEAGRPLGGFETRLEAELVRVVTERAAARPGLATVTWRRQPGQVERAAGGCCGRPGWPGRW